MSDRNTDEDSYGMTSDDLLRTSYNEVPGDLNPLAYQCRVIKINATEGLFYLFILYRD